MDARLIQKLMAIGYDNLIDIPGKGICGVRMMAFTYAIVYGVDEAGYRGRYCFHKKVEAVASLYKWNGQGDPDGNWIKHKSEKNDDQNPKYVKPGDE